MSLLSFFASFLGSVVVIFGFSEDVSFFVNGHGTMIIPKPRQPESVFFYSVGCMIGCNCSGDGKEEYPSLDSLNCKTPAVPILTNAENESYSDALTYNAKGSSPRGMWNRYMPWRSPGSSIPLDSCGIASGFLPTAKVQYPHQFTATNNNKNDDDNNVIEQGQRGTLLPPGPITKWVAGSIVDVSFYLIVNHGGGYQYRVCPKNNNDNPMMDESCFEQNPLSFADDVHTVVAHGKKKIDIPAMDVSVPAVPADDNSNNGATAAAATVVMVQGSSSSSSANTATITTWRRIPLPACNCDSGNYCSHRNATDRDYDVSYASVVAAVTDDTTTTEHQPYGNCQTGLQFVPPHIADGTWPEGYGYYVATLLNNKNEGKTTKQTTKSTCIKHSNSTICLADTENNCVWYTEKNVCYETRGSDIDDDENNKYGKKYNQTMKKNCYDYTDETSCLAQKCTWYDSPSKTVCYDAAAYNKEKAEGDDDDGSSVGEWHITDRVYAPTEPGEYILQWRWDNEQTPQIWTTCADIEVVGNNKQQSSVLSSSKNSNDDNNDNDKRASSDDFIISSSGGGSSIRRSPFYLNGSSIISLILVVVVIATSLLF